MYCDDDIISTSKGILFECPSGPKVLTISEDILLDALRKIIMNAIRCCRILLDLFYHQLVYVGNSCVEYGCMELKHDDNVGIWFSPF